MWCKMKVGTMVMLVATAVAVNTYGPVWRDTFQSLEHWVIDVQQGADTGNHEWEYYTNRSVNVFTSMDEMNQTFLVLHAQSEQYQSYNVTSGKIHSKEMVGPYGFFNIRATIPKGAGLWPAIWMFPIGGSPYGGWSAGGEIDIMETICALTPGYATIHFGGVQPNNTQYPFPPYNQYPFSLNWAIPHNYGVEWTPDYIQYWIDSEVGPDGTIQGTSFGYVPASLWYSMDSTGKHFPGNAPFNTPFNIILNLAVGGDWTCQFCCNATQVSAALPANLTVNFVEVYPLLYRDVVD